MIKPLQDRVLVKEIKSNNEEKTGSGIILIAGSNNSRAEKYEVVEIGPGIHTEKQIIDMEVKPKDIVLIDRFSGQEFSEDGVNYKLVRQADILAVIE